MQKYYFLRWEMMPQTLMGISGEKTLKESNNLFG